MRNFGTILAPLLLIFLASCGGPKESPLPPPPLPAEDPANVTWNQQANGLSYRIVAAGDINHEGNKPLGLTVCVYQLDDPSAFQALAQSPSGIDQLLNCQLDPAKARSSRAFSMQPGKRVDVTADRVEKARYLAVVAGYEHLKPELCAAVIPFPIHHEREGIIFKNDLYTAAPMRALIHLGAESVSLSGVERVQ
ncbi:MAG: type VI secretion lipoprotein TssJ [Desulfovibrionaceae bacterium]|nr:type VI secretion lipoprotein TssJ [Desulfovibrionaceae bacterium]